MIGETELAVTYQNLLELEDKITNLLPSRAIDKKPVSDLLKFLMQWSDSIWNLSKQYQPFYLSNEMIHHGMSMI
ncbi:MAG TPA: hypothetical protein VFQ58_02340, partial [Flavisolibacter sp.]|nr:hypothetical protein [Flavisolibacter sp.]